MTTTESLDMIQVLYGIRQMYMQVWETAEKRFSMGVPVQELFDWCKHEYAEKDTFLERVIEDFKQVYSAQSNLQPTCNQLATDCVRRIISYVPSAQSEIIRCKDCKWKQGAECVRFAEVRTFPDDFCSRAERRTDDALSAQPTVLNAKKLCEFWDSESNFCTLHRPSAQPEQKKGKWIVHPEVKNVYGGTYIECSQCGEKYVVQHMEDEKYCRNCGAKMEV